MTQKQTEQTRFGMSFNDWLEELDKAMRFQFGGFDSNDMPDWCWWDLWDSGLTPSEAFNDYMENQGYFA